jgi:hypothetical protein
LRSPFARAARTLATAALVLGMLGACGTEADPAGVIEREVFIATWVDLRAAALVAGDPLPEPERERVLGERGVTEEELLGFAEAHGDDPRFMAEVWTEIESRMRPAPAADSVAQP